MKKYLFSLFAFAFIGAGCAAGGGANSVVQGEWTLTFDLPNGWVMVQPYQPEDTPINLEGDIQPTDSEVILQSTDKHILPEGGEIDEDRLPLFGDITQNDYIQISVLKLDPRRIIPSEAEDLGDGFFKDGDVYYYKTPDANYKFTITAVGRDVQEAVDVIMTAQVVEETL